MRFAEAEGQVYGQTKDGTWVAVKVRLDEALDRFVYPAVLEEAVQNGERTSFLALTKSGELRKVCVWNEQEPSAYGVYDAREIVENDMRNGIILAVVPVALELGMLDETEAVPEDAYQVEADVDVAWGILRNTQNIKIWCTAKERVVVPRRKRTIPPDQLELQLPEDVSLIVRQWAKARNQTPQETVEGIVGTCMRMQGVL